MVRSKEGGHIPPTLMFQISKKHLGDLLLRFCGYFLLKTCYFWACQSWWCVKFRYYTEDKSPCDLVQLVHMFQHGPLLSFSNSRQGIEASLLQEEWLSPLQVLPSACIHIQPFLCLRCHLCACSAGTMLLRKLLSSGRNNFIKPFSKSSFHFTVT